MARTTEKQVRSMFELLCRKLGKSMVAYVDGKAQVGAWLLDCNPVYGGAQGLPFGLERRSAREMWAAMRFALDALAIAEGK